MLQGEFLTMGEDAGNNNISMQGAKVVLLSSV
jgi:hypothetical protein